VLTAINKKVATQKVAEKISPIFKYSDSFIVVINNSGIIEYCNPAFCVFLDYISYDLLGKDFYSITASESVKKLNIILKKDILQTLKVKDISINLAGNDKKVKTATFNISSFKDDGFEGILLCGQETADNGNNNPENISKILEILSSAPFGIVILDNLGELVGFNKIFTDITGYSIKDIPKTRSWFVKAFPNKNYRSKVLLEWEKFCNEDLTSRVVDIVCKNGKKKKIEFRLKKIEENWTAVFCADCTERIQKQNSIKDNIKELSRSKFHIERSNIQLKEINKKLKESELKLLELNKTKDKFFSILAHDLRSPFSALLSLSNLLVTDFDIFDRITIQNICHDINNSANNFFNLLENLLAWTRVTSDRMEMEPVIFNISEVINENIELLRQNAADKEIALLNYADVNIECYADVNMVKRVVQNLISNAIKFTYRNGKVEIFTETAGEFIKVKVKDNGVGINNEDLNNLFRIDVRQSTKGTDNETGTGLGLILCKELIEKIGGQISVSSVVEEGSEFVFTIKNTKSIKV